MHGSLDAATSAFLVASRALVAVAARSLAGEDVTLPQWRAMVILARSSSTTAGELAAALDVHQSTATRLCDRLVRKKLARRVADRDDRRLVIIVLTAPGRHVVERVTRRRADALGQIVSLMDADDREAAVRALTAFSTAAGEASEDAFGWFEMSPE